MITKLVYLFKRLLCFYWYRRYVGKDKRIIEDVLQTVQVRGCAVASESEEKQFTHLMVYYPEYAFLFFWRIKSYPWFYSYFVKDFGCKIFKSTQIDGGLMCYHPYATVINAKSIGRNFQFRNGLTIGNKGNDNAQLPVIGDNVTVGAQVVIIGDVQIGNHVIIGAGSVVVKDIPSYSVVAGNPARVIKSLAHDKA